MSISPHEPDPGQDSRTPALRRPSPAAGWPQRLAQGLCVLGAAAGLLLGPARAQTDAASKLSNDLLGLSTTAPTATAPGTSGSTSSITSGSGSTSARHGTSASATTAKAAPHHDHMATGLGSHRAAGQTRQGHHATGQCGALQKLTSIPHAAPLHLRAAK